MEAAIQVCVGGLSLGALYALIGLSLNVVVITNGVINFAQGDLAMVAVMTSLWAYTSVGLPLALAVVFGLVAGALVAAVVDLAAVRPLARGGTGITSYGWLVSTLGVSIILQNLGGMIFGTRSQQYPTLLPDDAIDVFGVELRAEQLGNIVVVGALVALFAVLVRRTQAGRVMRAIADNQALVGSFGVRTGRAITAVVMVSGVLVGVAGILIAPQVFANPFIGTSLLLSGFVAIVLGGIGNITGGLIGGLALGLIDAMAGRWAPPVLDLYVPFIVLMAWITLRGAREQGLLTGIRRQLTVPRPAATPAKR